MAAGGAEATGEPLAIICGGGSLPLVVADRAAASGRRVLLFPLRGFGDPENFAGRDCTWVHLGQLAVFLRATRAAGCRDVVWIGSLVRPSLWQIRPDVRMLLKLPRLTAALRGGDDHLLSSMARLFEQQGFRVLGAHEVAPEILVPEGPFGGRRPSDKDDADIAMGLAYLRATSAFDAGQAVVVAGKHILAVEAAEGTDHMLGRVGEMRANGRLRAPAGTGVLVKAPKQGQDRRFDLPSIGPQTVEGAVRAGLAGIAVVAGGSVIAEPERLVAAADRAGIFVTGVTAEP